MRWCPLLLVCSILPMPGPLRAQSPEMEPGTPVRVAHYCARGAPTQQRFVVTGTTRVLTGEFLSAAADTIRMSTGHPAVVHVLPAACVLGISVRDGWGAHTVTGLGLGLMGGALLGALVGSGVDFCILGDCGPATGLGAILGAPVGLVIGGAVGALIRTPRWRSIQVARGTPTVGLGGGGVAIAVRF